MTPKPIKPQNGKPRSKQEAFLNATASVGSAVSQDMLMQELVYIVEQLQDAVRILNAGTIRIGTQTEARRKQQASLAKLCARAEHLIILSRIL